MISDAESVILDEETSQDTGVINDQLRINYAEYNMLPICVEQADDVAFTLDKLVKQGKIPKMGFSISTFKDSCKCMYPHQNIRGILKS